MPAVPEDLMARLRAANEQFHQAAKHIDELDGMDMAQRQTLSASLRAAEKEIEDVTREIDAFLAPPPPQQQPPTPPSPA